MKPEDVPQHYVDLAMPAWSANTSSRPGGWSAEGQVRAVLAAVLPAHEAMVRARMAAEIADLREQAARLNALEAAGVDNWSGYEHAMTLLGGETL